jgi:outer membrane protein TolC
MTRSAAPFVVSLVTAVALSGCASSRLRPPIPALVAPDTQPSANFALNSQDVHPMYVHLLAIDLPTVMRTVAARNIDIQQARTRVDAARGQYESSVEAVFPVVAPSLAWTHFDGTNQNAPGTLVSAAFNNILPAVSIQWILNPGKVAFDIIASRRRLNASEDEAQGTDIDTARAAANQYYDLVLSQAHLGVAQQSLTEGEELVRITSARVRAGTGLPVDELRARADFDGRKQDLTSALDAFYQASIKLALTLHLDPSTTLVPKADRIDQTTLVREDISIADLLDLAARYRPDLQASRELVEALNAEKNAVVWGGLGPELQAGYTVGGISTDNSGEYSSIHEQQKGIVGGSMALGLSTFGQAKVSLAREHSASLDALRQADVIFAAVVSAHQASRTNAALTPLARSQLDSAQESLRIAQTNLQAGTMLTIDVLQAQDSLDQARLHYVDAVVHYNQSQINLLAAIGMLSTATFRQPAAVPLAQSTLPK